ATAAASGTASSSAAAEEQLIVPAGAKKGECAADSDCVATMNPGGCCQSYCVGYPITRAEHERRQAELATCPPGTECPPPAPCPPRDYRVEAVCRDGKCAGLKVPR
ncbi:MAG: hypothetical protein JRI23_02095, partial [Deltaproteobacteria bacterium]|nr:hypothetical protein [Deltaproteobacteria bacterium]MBW2530270.1 hypothetical protein [Deltaproteobacteria bacterium]